ncbi:MAG: hypothetical protein ETSY1_16950 [Candidatus Entotheonella factor]|uniref:Uncharacterized protein n=1 Tax=Entotheonella factor TaxID=1429438 RepID=W4LLN2_ENTF1|nr:MAG: hypothetical protein ETSY1_16950 [Candidatus Entotheonella factor]
MITNPILEEKYKVQRKLDEEAGYDVRRYIENVHTLTLDVEDKYGFKFKYGHIHSARIEPLKDESKSA